MSKQDQALYEQIKDLLVSQNKYIDEKFKRVDANFEPIRADIQEINKALNGNGHKGLIERVDALENWRWYVLGVVGILIFLIGFFGEEIKTVVLK